MIQKFKYILRDADKHQLARIKIKLHFTQINLLICELLLKTNTNHAPKHTTSQHSPRIRGVVK